MVARHKVSVLPGRLEPSPSQPSKATNLPRPLLKRLNVPLPPVSLLSPVPAPLAGSRFSFICRYASIPPAYVMCCMVHAISRHRHITGCERPTRLPEGCPLKPDRDRQQQVRDRRGLLRAAPPYRIRTGKRKPAITAGIPGPSKQNEESTIKCGTVWGLPGLLAAPHIWRGNANFETAAGLPRSALSTGMEREQRHPP
jgi:hypothetical protein